jgi:CheY-like chemotaxis protein
MPLATVDFHRQLRPGRHDVPPSIQTADNALGSAVQQPTCTVLYVEDHPVNVLLMQALFAKLPRAELRVATTGEAGLRMAVERAPDLLLLDLRLPDCHGTELLERMRGVPALASVPAVAVTAEDTRGDLLDAGFIEVWRKPMDLRITLARLDGLLDATADGETDPPPGGQPAWARTADRRRRLPPAAIPFPAAFAAK